MHKIVQEEKRARRRANRGHTDSDNTDPEEDGGEMDNFQNLQLGSLSPVVRLKHNLTHHFPRLTAFVLHRIWIKFSSFEILLDSPVHARQRDDTSKSYSSCNLPSTPPSMHMSLDTHRHFLPYHHDNSVSKEYIPQAHRI